MVQHFHNPFEKVKKKKKVFIKTNPWNTTKCTYRFQKHSYIKVPWYYALLHNSMTRVFFVSAV